jgi:hypothetical protein
MNEIEIKLEIETNQILIDRKSIMMQPFTISQFLTFSLSSVLSFSFSWFLTFPFLSSSLSHFLS